MGRPKKPPTQTIRVHADVAELAELLAPIYKQSTPDFVSDHLRQVFKKLSANAPRHLQERIAKFLEQDHKSE